jgi:disulfide bond formation protein DsbB
MSYRVLATSRSRFGLGFDDVGRTVALLSALALAGALGIQYIGGIPPCPLCLDQRIAYYAAVPLGLLAFAMAPGRPQLSRLILAVLVIAFAVNAGLGVYHAGVEWGWWPGPETCSGAGSIATTPDALLKSLSKTRVVRCDEAALRILGLSLAGYSAILSAILAIVSARGVLKR